MAAERAVLRWLKKEIDASGRFTIDAGMVERHLEAGTLNGGQKAAVSTLLLSTRHLVRRAGSCGHGQDDDAESRWSSSLARADWIVALAPSSSAARTLGNGRPDCSARRRCSGSSPATVMSATAAPMMPTLWAKARDVPWKARILVVDEASLVEHERRCTASPVCADSPGDGMSPASPWWATRRQLRSVEAGQPFRVLQKAGMETAVMDEVMRQRNDGPQGRGAPHDRPASPDLAIEDARARAFWRCRCGRTRRARAAALWLDLDVEAREANEGCWPPPMFETSGDRASQSARASRPRGACTAEDPRDRALRQSPPHPGPERRDLANWHENDVAVFHARCLRRSGDQEGRCIFHVIGAHDGEQGSSPTTPTARPARADPSKLPALSRVDLFETDRNRTPGRREDPLDPQRPGALAAERRGGTDRLDRVPEPSSPDRRRP